MKEDSITLKEFSDIIVSNIKRKLEELDITTKEFAELMGVSHYVVKVWLSGRHNFHYLTLVSIGIELGKREKMKEVKK